MVSETESINVEERVTPSVYGEMSSNPPVQVTQNEDPSRKTIEVTPINDDNSLHEIVGVSEPSIPHLGWFITIVALMLILINVFSIVLH